jgi:hypothetical protein
MTIPKVFVPNERLFASDLNDNFDFLDTAIGGLGPDYTPLEFAAAAESSGDLTLDVGDGARFSFTRAMTGTETLLTPVDMPEGSVLTFAVDATNTSTSAPVVQGRASAATTSTDTTSHAITLPTSIAVGELLLVVFSVDGAPLVSVSSGTGWNFLGQRSNGATVTGAVFWKIATGSDALTLATSVAEQSSHVSFRISGVKIPGNITASNTAATGANTDPVTHTMPGTDNRGRLWIATRMGDSTTVATVAPSGYSDLQTQAAAGAGGASTNTAEKTTTGTTNTEDPGTFTSGSIAWVSFTIGIDVTGSHSLVFSNDFLTPTPNVRGNSVLQILRLPSDEYFASTVRG